MLKKLFCPPCLIGSVLAILLIGGYVLLRGGAPEVAPWTTEEKIVSEVKEITISGTEFAFSPSEITVKEGDRVKITFQNAGSIGHSLVVEGTGVRTNIIGGGETEIIEFTAGIPGNYTISCSVSGHKLLGMEGSLIVQ